MARMTADKLRHEAHLANEMLAQITQEQAASEALFDADSDTQVALRRQNAEARQELEANVARYAHDLGISYDEARKL